MKLKSVTEFTNFLFCTVSKVDELGKKKMSSYK